MCTYQGYYRFLVGGGLSGRGVGVGGVPRRARIKASNIIKVVLIINSQ